MNTSMNIHKATSIAVRQKYFDGVSNFWLTELTIKTETGEFRLAVMGEEPLAIEGAEHINHVASDEVEA